MLEILRSKVKNQARTIEKILKRQKKNANSILRDIVKS